MVNPLWTFGVAVGMSLAVLIYQQYRRQQESMYNHEQPRNINFSDHDSWQSEEPSSSGSRRRRLNAQKSKSIKNTSCTICLNNFAITVNASVTVLKPCYHKFHTECIANWREKGPEKTGTTCPNCRSEIVSFWDE
ncbi:uncharacterized RING finger protein YBR062C isoform X2 [Cephus cinctus]|uniref:Uncharacterized RING finger protein YBR062C isoform X2 n=1 Tax=Cephus cinctus TaxID=211228 RepID=A0AAJ7C6X6_CEPCN|nr:uncharacterized RING finger protein YBR062C isoform X2 [Cephus cinctus]